jgi:hypothetical protein
VVWQYEVQLNAGVTPALSHACTMGTTRESNLPEPEADTLRLW